MPFMRVSFPLPTMKGLSSIKNGNGASTRPTLTIRRCTMYKEFCKNSHNLFDEAARNRAKTFWQRSGYKCTDNDDIYGVDLLVSGKDREFYCEVEVKQGWHGLKFKFDTLHIPVRKAKFLTCPTVFMVFNAGLHRAGLVTRKTVLNSPKVEVPNRAVAFGEKFFDIPAEQVKFFTIGV